MSSPVVWRIRCRYFFSKLADGEIFAYPSESVYALGCDALNRKAVSRVSSFKNSKKKRLGFITLVDSPLQLKKITSSPFSQASNTTKNPSEKKNTTIVLPNKNRQLFWLSFDDSVAVRVPQSESLKILLKAFGNPLISTSLNAPTYAPAKSVSRARVICRRREKSIKLLFLNNLKSCSVSRILDFSSGRVLRD